MLCSNNETLISLDNIFMLLRIKCLGVVTRTRLNLTEPEMVDMKCNCRLHPFRSYCWIVVIRTLTYYYFINILYRLQTGKIRNIVARNNQYYSLNSHIFIGFIMWISKLKTKRQYICNISTFEVFQHAIGIRTFQSLPSTLQQFVLLWLLLLMFCSLCNHTVFVYLMLYLCIGRKW